MPLYQFLICGIFVASVGRFRYVGPLSSQSVAFDTWDVSCHCYVGPMPQLVASAMWDLFRLSGCPRYVASVGRLRYGILVTPATCDLDRLRYVAFATSISSKQV